MRRSLRNAGLGFGVLLAASAVEARQLSFDERVAAQKAIEQVYWNHRLWPKENPGPKPPLSAVMSDHAIRAKVEDYLKKSNALETWWQRPVTAEQLQAELDRMAKHTRDGATLQELFNSLGNDPFVIAETLARQTLVERLIRNWYSADTRFHGEAKSKAEAAVAACASVACMKAMGGEYREETWKRGNSASMLDADSWDEKLAHLAKTLNGTSTHLPIGRVSSVEESTDAFVITAILAQRETEITVATVAWPKASYENWWGAARATLASSVGTLQNAFALPQLLGTACTIDTWNPTRFVVPDPRTHHSVIWTGTEMIVWGGGSGQRTNTGGRYNPSTDAWTLTSTGTNVPPGRAAHTAVWTGTEMIVWGGSHEISASTNTGGRYNPSTDGWVPTSTGTNVPAARYFHTAVWTGTEMIVWGGLGSVFENTGGRYRLSTDGWLPTSTGDDVPSARYRHTAVWTGTEMIVWGGFGVANDNTGGRYNASTDDWLPTSTEANVPSARFDHTAVWTGTEMIVWGGVPAIGGVTNTGARYSPSTDDWLPTSTVGNVPSARTEHTAVWTGTEMIVWAGGGGSTGGRYNPSTNGWVPTSTGTNVPSARSEHTAVWTGTEMIVWGGDSGVGGPTSAGGRYNPSSDGWVPTSTGTGLPAARSSHTAVWTGTEMIVWGGDGYKNTGGRYSPSTDNWTLTSMGTNVPAARNRHTAVWTGTEMLVWGGYDGAPRNTGGRYNPATDGWMPTSTGTNVPAARHFHTSVWTGTEMIVWGGYGGAQLNTGGRYNPSIDGWVPTSTGANVPSARQDHTAVWTGTQMIVWGGSGFNTGGRYNPATNGWVPTSTGANVPSGRSDHTAVWTGTVMIVWGGTAGGVVSTGGRYNPSSDGWVATSTGTNVPAARYFHTAVWTGTEMIVWGGNTGGAVSTGAVSTGGRYNPSADGWVPTSTGTNVPPARAYHTAVWTGAEMIAWGGDPVTATGGLYCACPVGRLYYRDADGDNFGIQGVSTQSCEGMLPAGYVDNDTDCDDANAQTYPGAPEVNDGVDNRCSGNVGSGSIDEISGTTGFLTTADKTKLSWTTQAGATSYDVARSPYRDHHAGCRIFHTTLPTLTDPDLPSPGSAFYYLVRAATPWSGSWGKRKSGLQRVVCAGCDSGANHCDDASVCTSGDSCSGSVCVSGAPVGCDDGNLCTDDICNPAFGCQHVNNTAPCNDGNACTAGDTCGSGACVAGAPLNCDDSNPCTIDSCNTVAGCQHANNTSSCNDGNVCTSGDVCAGGVCAGTLPSAANHLVISQLQHTGDGGDAEDEFVEIYNPTSAPVSLNGWSLQYKTNAGGQVHFVHAFGGAAGSVPAHGWYLVARAGYNDAVPEDQTYSGFVLGAGVGSLFLVNDAVQLTGACSSSASIVDRVGYGSGNCPEGNVVATPTENVSILRRPGGACGNGTDTNDNAADFALQSPSTPRNTASPPQP